MEQKYEQFKNLGYDHQEARILAFEAQKLEEKRSGQCIHNYPNSYTTSGLIACTKCGQIKNN